MTWCSTVVCLVLLLAVSAVNASSGPGRELLQDPATLPAAGDVTALSSSPVQLEDAANVVSPAASPKPCTWPGHCLGSSCQNSNDCDQDWICIAGQCNTGPGCPSGWSMAVGTAYDSWPKPGTKECVQYSGCKWAGQFSTKDAGSKAPCKTPAKWLNGGNGVMGCRYPELVVKSWSVAANFGKRYSLFNKKVQVMVEGKPSKVVTVNVIDKCADADCGSCCSTNTGKGKYPLLDLEKWPASTLLGFNPNTSTFDINDVNLPTAVGQRPGAPEKSVMPLCFKVVGAATARSRARQVN